MLLGFELLASGTTAAPLLPVTLPRARVVGFPRAAIQCGMKTLHGVLLAGGAQAPAHLSSRPCRRSERLRHAPRAALPPPANGGDAATGSAQAALPSAGRPAGPNDGVRQWRELIACEDHNLQRAWSAEDAHVLRRKGHLKEQDKFIEFIISMCYTHAPGEAFRKMESWVLEHRAAPKGSTLSRLVPSVGTFFTHLPLGQALDSYDEFSGLSRRRFVAPNFAEVRHVLNMAQVKASAPALRLITFDADGTLYADGAHFERDNAMIRNIIALLSVGLHVGVVTAAGYPGDASRFEGRLQGLLAAFRALPSGEELMSRFHLMGGECNYLLRCVGPDAHLEFVPQDEWQLREMLEWREEDIQTFLDTAEQALQSNAKRLGLPVQVVRKPRACGVVPTGPVIYETLEEIALAMQSELAGSTLPFCAFNGGNDVFVDVGNKSLGLQALQRYLGARPEQVLHVGDRFTVTGNDGTVRDCCSILWVANPDETAVFIQMLLNDLSLAAARRQA